MSEYREIPVEMILPPDVPMRSDSTAMSMPELIESIAHDGLKQPVGVTDMGDGTYKLRWGMRRTIAHRELGKQLIRAVVHRPDEGDAVDDMALENFQRTQLSDAEEAKFFLFYMKEKGIGLQECARRLRVPYARVLRSAHIMEGDPEVVEAFVAGHISAAQAAELVLFEDRIGRQNCLHWARKGELAANRIRLIREQREKEGVSMLQQDVQAPIANAPVVDYTQYIKCSLCEQPHPIIESAYRPIGESCWSLILALLNKYVDEKRQEAEGAPNHE